MTTTGDRTAALRAARAQDSKDKRQRVLDAIRALERAGTPITAAAVATAAGVSSWLVHADGIREHVQAARRRQPNTPTHPPPPRRAATTPRSHPPACAPTSPSPVRTSAGCAPNATNS
jgi:hypothetical protein